MEISKRFILQNKNQINKKLKSSKYIKDSLVIVYYKDLVNDFKYLTKDIDNIMVLGRNNKDLEELKNLEIDKNINYLTVHKSKGLEEDNVFVLNVVDDILGFPNKIKENNVLSYLLYFNHIEEERRLFFVALTRARNRTFLFTKKNKESLFIKELLKQFKYKIKILDLDQKNFK